MRILVTFTSGFNREHSDDSRFLQQKIKVFGGAQLRPNIHIEDMADAYLCVLAADKQAVDGKTFNVGYQNLPVAEIAELVKQSFDGQDRLR